MASSDSATSSFGKREVAVTTAAAWMRFAARYTCIPRKISEPLNSTIFSVHEYFDAELQQSVFELCAVPEC